MNEFFDANHHFQEVKSNGRAFKDEALEKAHEVKESVREYFEKIKESSINAEEQLLSYLTSNPIKTAGIIFLIGFVFSKLISTKRSN